MAEARNAIAVYEEHRQGIKLLVSDDGIEVSFHIPHPREGRKLFFRALYQMKRALLRGVHPASPIYFVTFITVFIAIVTSSSQDSWWRNNALAQWIWCIGEYMPVPFRKHLPHVVYLGFLTAWSALFGFIALMYMQRVLVRWLLSYRGFLHVNPKETNYKIWLWGAALKMLSGKSPLTYAFQSTLPKLPLPTLKDTCQRYLTSMRPLLNPEQFEKMTEMTRRFLKEEGPTFQRYLCFKHWWSTNYVTEWWESYVYLRGRNSIMIKSNYYVMDPVAYVPTTNPIARAAGLTRQLLMFKQMLDREQLPPLLIRGMVPLCMSQYKRIFSSTRLPGREQDEFKVYSPSVSKHIAVLSKGYFFKVPVYLKGKLMSAFDLQRMLEKVEKVLNDLPKADATTTLNNLAALTSQRRGEWANDREQFFGEGKNAKSLEVIESALFVLVLDATRPVTLNDRGKALMHGDGGNRWFDKSFNLVVFDNGFCGLNAEHSWADAPVVAHLWEYVIGQDILDDLYKGPDGSILVCQEENGIKFPVKDLPAAPLLRWDIQGNPDLTRRIAKAMSEAQEALNDLDLEIMGYKSYGKGFMKKHDVSPDAYIQMALQLAYYKDSGGKFTQTYEASMTRLYREGRTETVRPVTDQSKAFVLAMQHVGRGNPREAKTNPDSQATRTNINTLMEMDHLKKQECQALFKDACAMHQSLYRQAMSGQGVDRHLFALYCVSRGMKSERATSRFLHEALLRIPWRLSTSQQPQHQTALWATAVFQELERRQVPLTAAVSPGGGFGPVADAGYGVSYMVTGEDVVWFHVTSLHSVSPPSSSCISSPSTSSSSLRMEKEEEDGRGGDGISCTDSKRMMACIQEALDDIRDMLEEANVEGVERCK